jgi:uncharacterized membrane protein YdbT with pleckstrin-like domain
MRQPAAEAFWGFFASYFCSSAAILLVILLPLTFMLHALAIIGGVLLSLVFSLVFSIVWAWLTYQCWEFSLGGEVLRMNKGVVWKTSVSIPYERIQNVARTRGLFDSLLGLASLHIDTDGYSVTPGRVVFFYGASASEGCLPGLHAEDAQELADEILKRAKGARSIP